MLFDIQNLECQFNNAPALKKISLNVKTEQSLLILGPSGCGKTTLMNIMAGLLKPTSGQITFNGTNYASLTETSLDKLRAENFGFIFQKLHLLGHLNVLQNIALTQAKPAPKIIQTLINDLGLTGKENQKARDLSVGEAQRVAIARAVANTPKVIFADEPTSALDDINANKVMDLIFNQAQKTGASVIAVTHDARIKKRFDNIVEMPA